MNSALTQPAATAHGMGTDYVVPDWPLLTLETVNTVLRGFPQLQAASALDWHSPRPFSAATIAQTPAGPVFIKRHHQSVRNVEELHQEHRFITHLRNNGLPVVEVLTDAKGASAIPLGESTYEVHRLAPGIDLYRDAPSWTPFMSTAHAYAAGQALARLHRACAGYQAPPRHARVLVSSFTIFASDDPLQQLTHFIEARPQLADYLAKHRWRDEMAAGLLPFYQTWRPFIGAFDPLWTHNDWHASNLLWMDASINAQVAAIVDFGLAELTFALHDLATAIERNIIEWLLLPSHTEIVHIDHLDALLNGYTSLIRLSRTDMAALAALLPLAHVEFALSETDYFHRIARSPDNAALAYETYLLGHAAWFRTAVGADLLAYLRQWRYSQAH